MVSCDYSKMTLKDDLLIDIPTPTGPMRTHILRPNAAGRFPGVVLFSEIFQVTGPIHRTAAMIAGQGYVVAIPEVYHELEAPGCVLPYDQAGADRGNAHKYAKPVPAYDADSRAVLDHLQGREDCSGKLGAIGICLGGHLAFRAAMNPDVLATACFYATDIHTGSLGAGKNDDSLARAGEIKGDLMAVWGRQDPHVPLEGRNKIKARLEEVGVRFEWHEFNGAHAFLRDEGYRYDPSLAFRSMFLVYDLFHLALR